MNRSQLTSLVVAFACVGAVGVSASTLSSSVAADPSDALDPDYEVIPVAGGGLAQLESAIAGGAGAAAPGGGDGGDSRGGDSGPASQNEAQDGDGDESNSGDGGAAEGEGGGDGSGESAGGSGGEDGRSAGDGFGLGAGHGGLLGLLGLLVLAALVLATAYLCYRYRDRFLGLFATDGDEPSTDDPRPVPDGPPADDNPVFEAWHDLLSDLDVDSPETLTTRECADAAAAAGFEREEIDRLRLDFEAVRYGGQPVTDDRRKRARTARKRLGLNGESP